MILKQKLRNSTYLNPDNDQYEQQRIYPKKELFGSPLPPSLEVSVLWL